MTDKRSDWKLVKEWEAKGAAIFWGWRSSSTRDAPPISPDLGVWYDGTSPLPLKQTHAIMFAGGKVSTMTLCQHCHARRSVSRCTACHEPVCSQCEPYRCTQMDIPRWSIQLRPEDSLFPPIRVDQSMPPNAITFEGDVKTAIVNLGLPTEPDLGCIV